MTPNQRIAAASRTLADQAAPGSLDRRAAGCVAVAYSTTKTPRHARSVLETLADNELAAAALTLADRLTAE